MQQKLTVKFMRKIDSEKKGKNHGRITCAIYDAEVPPLATTYSIYKKFLNPTHSEKLVIDFFLSTLVIVKSRGFKIF